MMNSALKSVFWNSALSDFSKPTLRISFFPRKDGASQHVIVLQPSFSGKRSEQSRRGISTRKRDTICISAKEDDTEKSAPSSDHNKSSKSSDQEEIIALFKRIQASIAKERQAMPTSTQNRSSNNYKERRTTRRSSKSYKETPSSVSDLDALHPSRKQGSTDARRVSPQRKGGLKKETKRRTEDNSPMPDFKLTRLPSNFVKKSPIPRPAIQEAKKVVEVVGEQSSSDEVSENEAELERVGEMKVADLKELAKSRGIKGYSKLKKGELVELLKGLRVPQK